MAKDKKPVEKHSAFDDFIGQFKAHPFMYSGTLLILLLVIVAFVFPSLPGLSEDVDNTFGSWDGVAVSYVPGNYFARQRENIAQYYQSFLNEQNVQIFSYQIWREAFVSTVERTAALKTLSDAGYETPAEKVDEEIAAYPYFQENGAFSPRLYSQLDSRTRQTFWRMVKDDLAYGLFQDDIIKLPASEGEIKFLKAMAGPQRTFKLAAFSLDGYPAEELSAFALENPSLFQVVQFSRITLESEREAAQVKASLDAQTLRFEDGVTTHSKDEYADQAGSMGQKFAYEFQSEIADEADREAVLALAKGAMSEPVQTTAGWTIFRCDAEPRPMDTGDETLMSKVKSYLMENERGRVEDYFIKQGEELAGADFDGAAAGKGLTVKTFGPVPVNYGDSQVFGYTATLSNASLTELSGAASNEYFWEAAFSTPVGAVSKPVVLGSYVAVLLPVEETAPGEDALAEIESSWGGTTESQLQQDFRSQVLASPKFKDNFDEVYYKSVSQ
jgi:parvulin-like peptidyl-prolyl isomerase